MAQLDALGAVGRDDLGDEVDVEAGFVDGSEGSAFVGVEVELVAGRDMVRAVRGSGVDDEVGVGYGKPSPVRGGEAF